MAELSALLLTRMLFALVPLRMLGKGPTDMPEFGPSGHNTSTFAYPETEHGRDVYYNAYGDLDDGESYNSITSRLGCVVLGVIYVMGRVIREQLCLLDRCISIRSCPPGCPLAFAPLCPDSDPTLKQLRMNGRTINSIRQTSSLQHF
jgi:hypothetical protein